MSDEQFPDGKLNDDDEGVLVTRIGKSQDGGRVVIDFGKQVVWIGYPPDLADQFADTIKQHAQEIRDAEADPD